jgi:hypothetical protein
MTDDEIEQSLIRSSKMLLEGQISQRLTEVLLAKFGNLDRAFVIDCIPEQREDIYTVAVPTNTIATVEIPRDENAVDIPLIEVVPFDQYRRDTKSTTKAIRRMLPIVGRLWR